MKNFSRLFAVLVAGLALQVVAQDPPAADPPAADPPAADPPAADPPASDPPAAPPAAPPVDAPPAMATYPAVRLAEKGPFAYPNGIPYKVDTDTHLIRGPQHGFNICNSTTENQSSLCQTAWFNGPDDFCLWGPPELGRDVGDIEGIMVAYCSKPGHGTRLIPAGALTGLQYVKTDDYIQVVGWIDQTKINIKADDWGGEMDPHGADGRGNPMGGIMYSDSFTGSPVQVIQWHNFIGGNRFCLKLCDGNRPNDRHFCEHIFDRIGIDYNCPTNAQDGVFEACEGENQDFPGTYTTDGVVMTYTQPHESLGAITTIPYTARVPQVSNCRSLNSAEVFRGLPTPTGASSSPRPTGSGITASRSGAGGAAATGTSDPQTGGAAAAASGSSLGFGIATGLIGLFSAVALLI